MRIYEGDYAYEVERVFDSATLVETGWRYNTGYVHVMNCFARGWRKRGMQPRKPDSANLRT